MSNQRKYAYTTIEVGADLLERATPLFANYGLTPEQAAKQFVMWVVKHPEKAVPFLLDAKTKYGSEDD